MRRFLLMCSVLAIAACHQEPPPAPVAAAPPPPPPAPPAPTSFNVYFDYNSARLGSEGREVVSFAANQYKTQNPGSVQVTGHTDPKGSAKYNQTLSLKRASVVAAALVQDGVPRNSMTVSGQGETAAGETPGDDRDRRVEISFGGGGLPPEAPPPPGPPPPPSS
jgi:outer membrane protein OmpA-like peptidoglycan-associated protein